METSRPFRQIAPDQLQIRDGGGCLSLFGLPFLLAGIFVALIGAGIVPMRNAHQAPVWGLALVLLVGLIFVAAGGALVMGRRWITLDAGRGMVLKQWGLFIPMRAEEHSLVDYDAVVVRFAAGDSDTSERYPVLLRAAAGKADLTLTSPTAYGGSREAAAAVAKLLRLPLVDATTDHESVTGADRVDAPYQERLRAGDDREEEAPRPLRMQCQVRESGSAVEIVIPGSGFKPGRLLGFVVFAGLLAYVAPQLLWFFRRTNTPDAVQLAFFGFALLLFVGIPLLGVIHSVALAVNGRTVVKASAEGIAIEERRGWRVQATRIPTADILGLDYGTAQEAFATARRDAEQRMTQARRSIPSPRPGGVEPRWVAVWRRLVRSKGIIVKSRSGLVTFGAGLPDDEVRYLHAIVTRVLGGADGRRW
jgi:hypothetical protein